MGQETLYLCGSEKDLFFLLGSEVQIELLLTLYIPLNRREAHVRCQEISL